ncbi:hypothetical protein [Neobacillus drentensis]|uniref:hypothetical protein n=1 Tax=Neobacillus drentensis TaxID=220684 RepID=UPI002FFD92E3
MSQIQQKIAQLEESNQVQKIELANQKKLTELLLNRIEALEKRQNEIKPQIIVSQVTKPATTYKSYTNPRFGFKVEYPTNFKIGPEPTNGSGRDFSLGEANIRASAGRVEGWDIQTLLSWSIEEANESPISYKKVGDNWFAISYKDKDDYIVYQKSIIKDGFSYELEIRYPLSQQNKYETMVEYVVKTFVPGNGD